MAATVALRLPRIDEIDPTVFEVPGVACRQLRAHHAGDRGNLRVEVGNRTPGPPTIDRDARVRRRFGVPERQDSSSELGREHFEGSAFDGSPSPTSWQEHDAVQNLGL